MLFFHIVRLARASQLTTHKMEPCKTASTCTPEVAQGTHVFDILGYSMHRGTGSYIRSRVFTVGGHDWAILFYPDGYCEACQDYISVYLELCSTSTYVRASCELKLLNQCTGSSVSVLKTGPRIFSFGHCTASFAPQIPHFKRRSEIENSVFLRDDRLTIECIVSVIERPHVAKTRSFRRIDMPPSDMAEHVGRLLEEKEGLDVSFSVGGETVEAHRLVLAMRSPVFKAELYGPMREATTGQSITVKDMEPAVFKALIHFIYTDSLPRKHLEGDDNTEMIRLLLVAADRYAIERLKLVCQSVLCEDLNVDTVATTLAVADQHNCGMLKDACLEFMEMSNDMDAVVATQGFKDLKRTCPSLVVEALEKRRKFHKA
ncbi:unnamed protein product [Alopecurus aequalis]